MRNCIKCGKAIELGIMDENKNMKCISCAVLDSKPGTLTEKKQQLKADIVICQQRLKGYENALINQRCPKIRERIEKAVRNEQWQLDILKAVVRNTG